MSEDDKVHPFTIGKNELTSLFRDHYPNLVAYACLFVDNETAEDIAQEVFEERSQP